MVSIRSSYREKRLKTRRRLRMFLLCLLIVTGLSGIAWKGFFTPSSALVKKPLSEAGVTVAHDAAPSDSTPTMTEPDHIFTWTITAGDTLSSIFDTHGISQGDMCQVL